MLKLGELVKDKASGSKGMLTHYHIDMDSNENYLFQPAGLNPETQLPIDTIWLSKGRVVGGKEISPDLPMEVLGTQAEDIATGFKGMVIAICQHINCCIHLEVKPKGTLKKSGETIKAQDFDIRRLKGPAIKQLTEEERDKSTKKNPSPAPHPSLRTR